MSGETGSNRALLGRDILEAIKESGIEFVVSVPDITTSEGLLRPLAKDPSLRHVRVCKEDEGVAICAGLSFCGRRGLLMMQSTGMYDSVNAIRSVAVEYGLPICMLVGLQGALADEDPRESPKHIVRVAQPGARRPRRHSASASARRGRGQDPPRHRPCLCGIRADGPYRRSDAARP